MPGRFTVGIEYGDLDRGELPDSDRVPVVGILLQTGLHFSAQIRDNLRRASRFRPLQIEPVTGRRVQHRDEEREAGAESLKRGRGVEDRADVRLRELLADEVRHLIAL